METELIRDYELATVFKRSKHKVERTKVTCSKDSFEAFIPYFKKNMLIKEEFRIFLLDTSNTIIGQALISEGGVRDTVVDIKIIAKFAIETLANAVILAHNHPSLQVKPSTQDVQLTSKIKKAFQLLDIHILDHIILCDNTYYSFADQGSL